MNTSMNWAKWKIIVHIKDNNKKGVVAYHRTKKDALESLNTYMKKDEFFDMWYDTNNNIYTVEKA